MDNKAPDAFRTISEVADDLDLPQHVLRFWESRFREIKPMKRGGGRRYYRPDDIDLLRGIRHLLYGEGYTIRGVQRILREQGSKFVQAVWTEGAPQPPHIAREDEELVEETAAEEEATEDRGLLRRLPSLIGRDLAERETVEREEPPLTGAPVPRIDDDDVAIHRASGEGPPAPTVTNKQAPPGHGLTREDLSKLHAALHELGECRKMIDAALAPPSGG
ncbi:MAG TPA: MerR family transcriptional regulator [Pseudolabrys sp.]|nr:MerR family transcriptional regulator [Pseudolabrys sp.]